MSDGSCMFCICHVYSQMLPAEMTYIDLHQDSKAPTSLSHPFSTRLMRIDSPDMAFQVARGQLC